MKKACISKRILNGALGLVLAFTTVFQVSGNLLAKTEKSDKAATIRLEKTEGTVSVENSSKGAKTLSEGMRLYDGDHELTEDISYAWMSLDDTKMIKLDEESESEVRKKGKKLEVLLDSGSLFFNVTEPLADDETLNIRTSTMIAGIRGTCGWVRILDGLTTRVYLLEGRLDCLVCNPVDGSTKTITLKGGEYADFCVYHPDTIGDKCDILIDRFTREDIEGYVLVELVGDNETIQKIYDDSGIDLRDLTAKEAEDRLKAEQERSKTTKNKIDGELNDQERYISKDPVWDRSKEETEVADQTEEAVEEKTEEKEDKTEKNDKQQKQDNTKPTENTINNDTNNTTNNTEDNKDESVVYLTMPQTATTVQGYLNKSGVKQVVLLPGSGDNTLHVDIAFNVPSEKTLEARDKVNLDVIKGQSMTVNGTADLQDSLSNSGIVTVKSSNTLKVKKVFNNTGVLENTSTGRIVLTGGLVSSGTIRTAGKIEAGSGATSNLITLNGGSFTITGGSIISSACNTLIKLGSGADVTFSLTGGVISNEKTGGEALNVTEGNFKLDSLGTDINGVSDSLLGSNVNYEKYGAGSVWRTDQRFHLVLLKDVDSYPVAIAGNIEHGRLEVPARVEVGAVVPIGVYPDEGYELNTLTVNLYDTNTKTIGDSVSVTSDHKFTMPRNNVIIGGSFKEKSKDGSKFTVNFYSEDGSTLLYSGSFEKGTAPTFGGTTPTKASDAQYSYTFEGWTTGGTLYRSGDALASVTGNTDYTASFARTPVPYALNFASTMQNGTVSAGGTSAGYGTTVTLTVTPAASHKYVNGSLHVTASDGSNVAVTAGSNNQFTFTMPAKAVTISADFEYDGAYELGAVYFADGGTVSFMIGNEYVTSANPGDLVFIDARPNTDYEFRNAPFDRYVSTGNNTSAVTIYYEASVGKYRFNMPTRDAKDIEVDFTYVPTNAAYHVRNFNVQPSSGTSGVLAVRPTAGSTQTSFYAPGTRMSITLFDPGYNLDSISIDKVSGGSIPLNTGTVYSAGTPTGVEKYFFMPNSDIDVTAQLSPKTYTITYDMNAGGDTTAIINDASYPTSGTYLASSQNLPTNVTRTGYRFEGWYLVASPSSSDVRQTATAINTYQNITYYAKWRAVTTLTMPQAAADIQSKLNDPTVAEVELAPGTASNTLELSTTLTIPVGKTFTIKEGVTVKVLTGGKIQNYSGNTLNNQGIIYVGVVNGIENGDYTHNNNSNARIVNDGYIFINANSGMANTGYGVVQNNGSIYNKTGMTNPPSSAITVTDMGVVGDAIYIKTRIGTSTNYKLDFFGNGEIGANTNAYVNASYISASITQVEIHNGITKIGEDAFYVHLSGTSEDYGFTSLILPDTLKIIDKKAFCNLIKVQTLTIPEGVTTIGEMAFYRQSDKADLLQTINLPSSLTSVGNNAFTGRNTITSVEIPGNLQTIGQSMFSDCPALQTVVINEGVTTIGKEAFKGCTALSTIEFPSTVTVIGEGAFKGCISIESLDLPQNLETIDKEAFYNCHEISALDLPSSVEVIGESAFYHLSKITQLVLPTSLETIGYGAFDGCSGLTQVSLPGNLSTFSANAFKNIDIENLVIPSSVTTLQGSLSGMHKLKSITIYPNIETVNDYIFYGMNTNYPEFTDIYFMGTRTQWEQEKYRKLRPDDMIDYYWYYNHIFLTNHVTVHFIVNGEEQTPLTY